MKWTRKKEMTMTEMYDWDTTNTNGERVSPEKTEHENVEFRIRNQKIPLGGHQDKYSRFLERKK